jgi:hypothetical protein
MSLFVPTLNFNAKKTHGSCAAMPTAFGDPYRIHFVIHILTMPEINCLQVAAPSSKALDSKPFWGRRAKQPGLMIA